MRVWKYKVAIGVGMNRQPVFDMPEGAVVLDAQVQGNTLCIWALVDPLKPKTARAFALAYTGEELGTQFPLQHVGTASRGPAYSPLVIHVFELVGATGLPAAEGA